MALHWDISKVSRWKQKMNSPNNRVFFNALLHSFLIIGIREVSEKNIDEIYERLQRYENIFGPLLETAKSKPVKIDKSDLRKWIGLTTNVGPLTNAEFDKHIRNVAIQHKKNLEWRNKCRNT